MVNARLRLITALTGFALAATLGLIGSTPAQAEPDIDDVKTKVDRLYHEAEQASERYNEAKLELDLLTKDLGSLQSDQQRQDTEVETTRDSVQDSVVRQMQGESLSAAGSVLVSEDSRAFLSQMSTMAAFGQLQDHLFDDYSAQMKALDIRKDATSDRVREVEKLRTDLETEKETIDTKYNEAKSLLSRLEDKERQEILASGDSTQVPSNVPASGRAAAAVKYAMAQVGDSYVYGAAGPSAFDCSGLTMMAWAQAGVGLPHSSSAQYGSGQRVSQGDLQAGDLVFYYSPISHVGMYIGNGLIVHAANPGAGVKVSSLNEMPYVGAVRPG